MILETERLILRPWEDSDAEVLYEYAKNPNVGPAAGWPPHPDVEYSLEVIRTILNGDEAYAVCLKDDGKPIGAIELMPDSRMSTSDSENECELGFWIAEPFWGQGIIPEAAQRLLQRAFDELGMNKVWCGYYDGNIKSKRVQEKLGFIYEKTLECVDVPLLGEKRTEHFNSMTSSEWHQRGGRV